MIMTYIDTENSAVKGKIHIGLIAGDQGGFRYLDCFEGIPEGKQPGLHAVAACFRRKSRNLLKEADRAVR